MPEYESISRGVPLTHLLTQVVLTSAVESSILNLLVKWARSKLPMRISEFGFEEQRTESYANSATTTVRLVWPFLKLTRPFSSSFANLSTS